MTATSKTVMTTKSGTAVNHGNIGAYTNHGCRCELCADAHREYQREYRRDNPHQRHLAVLRERVRYWKAQVEVREFRKDADPSGYLKNSGSVTEARGQLRYWETEYETARLSSDTARDRTSE